MSPGLGFLALLLLLAPLTGFGAGFLAGTLRVLPLKLVAALIVLAGPLAVFVVPLYFSSSSDERVGASFGLAMFGFHIALWMLFAALGIVVGTARSRRAE